MDPILNGFTQSSNGLDNSLHLIATLEADHNGASYNLEKKVVKKSIINLLESSTAKNPSSYFNNRVVQLQDQGSMFDIYRSLDNLIKNKRTFDYLSIKAHGNNNTLVLASGLGGRLVLDKTGEVSESSKRILGALKKLMNPGGHIHLISCRTGLGLAQEISRHIEDVSVSGSTDLTNGQEVNHLAGGIINLYYNEDKKPLETRSFLNGEYVGSYYSHSRSEFSKISYSYLSEEGENVGEFDNIQPEDAFQMCRNSGSVQDAFKSRSQALGDDRFQEWLRFENNFKEHYSSLFRENRGMSCEIIGKHVHTYFENRTLASAAREKISSIWKGFRQSFQNTLYEMQKYDLSILSQMP